jgi:hypothetical protein
MAEERVQHDSAEAPDVESQNLSASRSTAHSAPGIGSGGRWASVFALQRKAGNRAVSRMLESGHDRANQPADVGGPAGPVIHAAPRRIQRQHVQMASGRRVGNVAEATDNTVAELRAAMDRLVYLGSMKSSDATQEWKGIVSLTGPVPPDRIPKTIAAIRANEEPVLPAHIASMVLNCGIVNSIGKGQYNMRSDIEAFQAEMSKEPFVDPFAMIAERPKSDRVPDGSLTDTFKAMTDMKKAVIAGTFRPDLFKGTRPVTPEQHRQVDSILTPGSVVVGTTVMAPPPMTDSGPGGKFETDMIAALKPSVAFWANNHRALKTKVPFFDMKPGGNVETVAAAAQAEVERFYGPYLTSASRLSTDKYRHGSYTLTEKLGDQSTRPVTLPDALGWATYWMTLQGVGQEVLNRYKCIPSRSPDDVEFARVRAKFVMENQSDVLDAIKGWPAEAGTGTVFLQPYVNVPDETAARKQRWDLFTTLIHEMMHIAAHSNFTQTAQALGGTALKYFNEGFAEVMRHDLWDGTGNLAARLATDQMKPLRAQVEGKEYPYDASVIVYHPDYAEYAQARQIVQIIGAENAKAAFFLGHTELLGIGQGSQSAQPLAGIGTYEDTDARDANIVVAPGGETVDQIRQRASAVDITQEDGTAYPGGDTVVVPKGTRLKISGLSNRWVKAVRGDTIASLARQNSTTPSSILHANGMDPGYKTDQPLTPGQRLLIPSHRGAGPAW